VSNTRDAASQELQIADASAFGSTVAGRQIPRMFPKVSVCFSLLTIAMLVSALACQPATTPGNETPEQLQVGRPLGTETPIPQPLPPDVEVATVTRVEAADTLLVSIPSSGPVSVKLLGVELPESMTPGKPIACFGAEAFANTRSQLEGKIVYLEKDLSTTDDLDRLLRYVYWEDGRMVNEHLARSGYATEATMAPDLKYQARLKQAQQDAQTARRGMWSRCSVTLTPTPTPSPTPSPTVEPNVEPTAPPPPPPRRRP
jgi:micrococcal nuclease